MSGTDKQFVHLHVHTEYSLLDGANRCGQLAAAAEEMGMPGCAITDHGVMYGCIEFYNECRKHGVNPILGCEFYVAPSGHTRRDTKEQYHLIVLAENDEGWHNLMKLASIAATDGFYRKPRIDHDLLAKYSKGLILSSACLAGEIPRMIMDGNMEGALARANMYRDIVGKENFYLEIQSNSIPQQDRVNRAVVEMSRAHGFPLIATNDAHYLRRADAAWHDILLCVGTKSSLSDPERLRFTGDDYYFRSPQEMWDIFGSETPDALTNTVEISSRCSVELKLGTGNYLLPVYEIPEGETLATHLRRMTEEGLAARLGGTIPDEYRRRMEYELGVIESMDFPGYFCIVADIIASAKEMHIPVGPGRGSAAGSLVAWACKITELDPIKHGLLFERFLNPERISMPDIDTDISDKQRDEVIDYIVNKYGSDHVAQIITFGRMMSKNAVRDVGRAMDVPYADVEKIAKLIPDPVKSGIKKLSDALEKIPDLKAAYDSDPTTRKIIDEASKMEGLARQCGKHAAGIVITPKPMSDMVPVTRVKDSESVTQFPMEPVEKLGLVKMDFLGLTTLSIIEGALENIRLSRGEEIDLTKIPMDDAKVFEMLRDTETFGVFQLESDGMRNLISRLKPDRFEDMVALVALFRPGPLDSGMADQYVRRKHGQERVEYPHPNLSESLAETYGVILYQEQVMQCASRLAGYSLGEADLLRRAMGKKKVEVMAEQRAKFVEGAEKNGVPAAKAGEIFDIIEKFAGYGFNKSHSAAYALLSYQTAWLKVHYPQEFLASHLSSMIGGKHEDLADGITKVRSMGIEVTAPDINRSAKDFTVSDGKILFGLSGVAKVGSAAVDAIVAARADGPFKSLWDFASRVDLRAANKGVVESLIKAGAFSEVESNRRRMLEALPAVLEIAGRRDECAGQRSLFDEETSGGGDEPQLPDVPDYGRRELLALEHEAMGIYISGHPFDEFKRDEARYATCKLGDVAYWRSSETSPTVLGLLVDFKEKYTKKGDTMGILILEDAGTQLEVVCFARSWPQVKPMLVVGAPYVVRGRIDAQRDISLLLDDIRTLDEVRASSSGAIRISFASLDVPDEFYFDLCAELSKHPGSSPILLDVATPDSRAVLRMKRMTAAEAPELVESIDRISHGRATVTFGARDLDAGWSEDRAAS